MIMRALIYGDSNTYGYDPRGSFQGRYPESTRWTSVLKRRLTGAWDIHVDAMNGREIPHTIEQWEDMDHLLNRSAPLHLFAIMLGTNDYCNLFEPEPEAIAIKMKALLEHILALDVIRACNTTVLLIAPPPIVTAQDEYYYKYDTTDGRLSAAYRFVASELGISFADAARWGMPLAADGVHLTEEAQMIFADRMEEILAYLAFRETVS